MSWAFIFERRTELLTILPALLEPGPSIVLYHFYRTVTSPHRKVAKEGDATSHWPQIHSLLMRISTKDMLTIKSQ